MIFTSVNDIFFSHINITHLYIFINYLSNDYFNQKFPLKLFYHSQFFFYNIISYQFFYFCLQFEIY